MRVGLVQINMGLTWSSLLPYSVGLLQAYAERHARERHDFLLPLYKRVPVDDAVEQLRGADLVGFSAYVWNERLSLEIARRLKETSPETRIVFGGPQVPDRSEPWLREHRFVDVAVHGEGEAVFTSLLDGRDDTPGISFLTGDEYVLRPKAPRIADMSLIPSPFLTDVFAPLMEANPQERWVMMWETNRGCPFSCTFCDWGGATQSKVYRFDDERIAAEIDWMGRNKIGFVFCCDANFGMLKRDTDITEAVIAANARYGFPFSLSVQSTKNATERAYKIQKLLNESLNAYGVTLSLQSTNAQTLANIRRENISSETYTELQRRFARDGVYTYTDIILGLPGESYDDFANSVGKAISDGQHNHVQFHNCSLLPNAEMNDPDYVARWGIRTVPQLIRNPHDSVDQANEIEEYLPTVVGTDAMPAADWVRSKRHCWLVDLFYFDRLLQLPLALLEREHGVPVRTSIEALAAAETPTLAGIARKLHEHAGAIQLGGPEYVSTPAYGNLIWPADQHTLIELVLGRRLDAFYDEAAAVLTGLADDIAVEEALELNAAMLRVPFRPPTQTIVLSHNVLEYHRALAAGDPIELEERIAGYVVDRTAKPLPTPDAWFEHLVWCHGKDKRGYLNEARPTGARASVLTA
jgi:radical SAM superfamily enzyme YgiQ (UPF0313 family)